MKAQETTPLSQIVPELPSRKAATNAPTRRQYFGILCSATRWSLSALLLFLILLCSAGYCAPVKNREPSVGIEGTIERVLNSPDYTPMPVTENTPLILRVHSVKKNPEGKYNYTFAYIGLQSGVFNLADYLQNSAGKRVRDMLPVISVTVQALLPDNASKTLPNLPTAPAPRSIPYRPAMFLLILGWLGWGAALFYQKPKKTAIAPTPATPPKTLGEILEPLALKAARKTISSEEKMLLEQTIIRYWSERLHVEDFDAEEKRNAILEHREGGLLLRSIERWLYQPSSLILSSEVTKVLAPYFKVPARLHHTDDEEAVPDADDEQNRDNEETDDEQDELDNPKKLTAGKTGSATEDEDEEDDEPIRAGRSAVNSKNKNLRTKAQQRRATTASDIEATP